MEIVPSNWEFKGEEAYTDRKFLMSTPFPVALTLALYLWFVLRLGPEFMKRRKPFQLNRTIAVYNILQVLLSCYIFQAGFRFHYRFGLWSSTCNIKNPDVQNWMLDTGHIYFLAKVIELLDTIFFVLRKKDRQITFLHVYHHTIMVVCTWSITKYIKNDSSVFIAAINSLVHIVMYTYYGLSVFPSLTKFLWWKKYITVMQLIQFVMMFIHMVISHVVSECKPTYYLLTNVCFNTVFFMYLFGKFYKNSYIKNNGNDDSVKVAPSVSKHDEKLSKFISHQHHHRVAG